MDYVRWEVDLPTLATLTKYWARYPPVHVSVAAYLGIGDSKPTTKQTEASFDDLMASIPQMAFTPPNAGIV